MAVNIGILLLITKYSVTAISKAEIKNITDIFRLIVIAITNAPATINGARVSKRILIATLC